MCQISNRMSPKRRLSDSLSVIKFPNPFGVHKYCDSSSSSLDKMNKFLCSLVNNTSQVLAGTTVTMGFSRHTRKILIIFFKHHNK